MACFAFFGGDSFCLTGLDLFLVGLVLVFCTFVGDGADGGFDELLVVLD